MRKFLASIILTSFSVFSFAQSLDEKIGEAMNTSDWFALDSIYNEASKDSISEFLEVYSRCLIGNRFNRTDISIPAFAELLNTQSLDMGNLVSSAIMYAMDLSRVGEYAQAAQMLSAIIDATKPHLKDSSLSTLEQFATLYSALSNYTPYQITFEDNATGVIPFKYGKIGPKEKLQVLIHLENSTINGIDADIIFDTGAGVNIISDSLAAQLGLIPLDTSFEVKGHELTKGRYAIAKELKIGNITVSDVPFLITSLSTNNTEADKYFKDFNLVVGCELMLQLKDLTIDFQNKEIIVPSVAPSRSDEKPNMCFSSGMGLLAKAIIKDTPLNMIVDTGKTDYATLLNTFFEKNKAYIRKHSVKEKVRTAGIGGVNVAKHYRMLDTKLTLDGNSVIVPHMFISPNDKKLTWTSNNVLGLNSLMLFSKVRFNMVDFVLTTEL